MAGLNDWLQQATRHLSKDSSAQVRTEIREHYEAARDAAIIGGATAEEADRLAVIALGNAKTANCQYRTVLLTSAEARLLRDAKWEAKAVCARPWLKRLLLAIPPAALLAAAALSLTGENQMARVLFVSGMGTALLFAAPFLPLYTPSRARAFRLVKWVVLAATFALAFGPEALKWSWLLISCLWPLAWVEWTRVSIRRKLRVADWPKHLYL